MRVDPLCAVIRFAPVGVLLAVHCVNGHWPSDDECAERVMEYGFSVDLFRRRPTSVFTHLFVHISSQHLLSNVFSMAATLTEFGEVPDATEEEEREENRASSTPPPRQASMASQLRNVWAERSPLSACLRTTGAFLVWAVGGMVGGLGGQLLYNDSTVALRRERATRAKLAVQDLQQQAASAASSEGGVHIISTLSRHAHVLRQRYDAFNFTVAAEAQETVNRAMMMCGASAGICALSGFNAVYYRRPITALCMIVPEVVALSVDLVNRCVALLGPKAGSSGNRDVDAQRRALQSTWRTLMPGQTVGHAAHVGGFVAGASIAYVWLWAQRRRLQRAQVRPSHGSK